MLPINGNTQVSLEKKTLGEKNSIGEREETWTSERSLDGFLDYMSGNSNRFDYNAKLSDTTHVFVCDYVNLGKKVAENYRLTHDGDVYEILHVDNPMGLDYHLEFYLKYTGG